MTNHASGEHRVLFVGAHCDDIEIGCGGTAASYAALERPIAFAIATPGPHDNRSKKRRSEATKAAGLLSLSQRAGTLFFGSLPDGGLTEKADPLRTWLKDVANRFRPDTVFFHRDDEHTDHQAVYKAAIGVFQTQDVFLYCIPRPSPDKPFDANYAHDISAVIRKKVAMCKCHTSQPKNYIGEDSVRTHAHKCYLDFYAKRKLNKNGYAEAFIQRIGRSPLQLRTRGASKSRPVSYGLRVIESCDGTLKWTD
jgi:LmbE family N-acetylglucosaminyl deacetylase